MKVGRDYSWWVAYEFGYEYPDPDTGGWAFYYDSGEGRFNCRKKDIKKTVVEYIKDVELANETYRNLTVSIPVQYMTTPEEV
jgi:hypothetical protein